LHCSGLEIDMASRDLEPTEAIRAAKKWLAETYSDEKIGYIGLEEVRWKGGKWEITLGFNRSWDIGSQFTTVLGAGYLKERREYKVIVVSGKDNSIVEMRNREAA
jgi:hypothetical protein